MNEKFVAYIDILGFSEITHNSKSNATQKLREFYQAIYDIWSQLGYANNKDINGLAFSDSLIIYSKNDSSTSLKKILEFIQGIYSQSLFRQEILLRGSLAKGEFYAEERRGFENLRKDLIVGQAFIDAYRLESSSDIKGARFIFERKINDLIRRNQQFNFKTRCINKQRRIYEFLWVKPEDLNNNDENLHNFYQLAKNNKWSEHYIQTLDLFCSVADDDSYSLVKSLLEKNLEERTQYENRSSNFNNFMKNLYSQKTPNKLEKFVFRFIREKFARRLICF